VAALEEWCKRGVEGYRGVHITNMSSSWRDGQGFCALIHRHRPDLIDWEQVDPSNAVRNCSLAFSLAHHHLGIPPLLDVEDVVKHASPDERSIITYLSQFYHKLEHNSSGLDSGFSSLKNSFTKKFSSEEEPGKIQTTLPRRGAVHSLYYRERKKRPLSWHGSMEEESPPIEHDNPFREELNRNVDYGMPVMYENLDDIRRYETQQKKRPDTLCMRPRSRNQGRMVRRTGKEYKQVRNFEGYGALTDNSTFLPKTRQRTCRERSENDGVSLRKNNSSAEARNSREVFVVSDSHEPYKLAAKQNIIRRKFFQKNCQEKQKKAKNIDLFQLKYERIKDKNNLTSCYGNFIKNCADVGHEVKSKSSRKLQLLANIPDTRLVIYKLLPVENKNFHTPYREPSDKYSIEYLWNIGATIQRDRRARIRYL